MSNDPWVDAQEGWAQAQVYAIKLAQAERERDEFKDKWERTIDELGRVIHILAATDDVTVAVEACQPHATDLARKIMRELDEARGLLRECRRVVEVDRTGWQRTDRDLLTRLDALLSPGGKS